MESGGEFIGNARFEVRGRIGAGGMGVVYRVLDRRRGVEVALKTLRSLNPEAVLRFKGEFRSLQDLEHPNLVSLGELISEGGLWYFTMELIEGVDFLAWVRPGGSKRLLRHGGWDEERLRLSLGQLASALAALHERNKVHRDIKPSNLLVDRAGRLVLLDFGLATEAAVGRPLSDVNVVGTADYMAPEQGAGRPVGPEADLYSVGVLLYEAITGCLPFAGPPLEVLMEKQRREPPPPSALVPDVPPDLDLLCQKLLAFDPAARPTARQLLSRLGPLDAERVPIASVSSSGAPPFVGRERELAMLAQALDRVREGRTLTVLVHGESGVGKSALVRQFTERSSSIDHQLVVLAGRCFERESVPYKAVDGVIDALSRAMTKMPPAEAAALVPLRAGLLAQVFPVLRRVQAIAQAPSARDPGSPQELRTRVFNALRELLARLSLRRPLILVIDDLQWADSDSLALLAEILRPPEAPPLLLVATVRDNEAGRIGHDLRQWATNLPGSIKELRLAPLPPEEATQLAELLLRRVPAEGQSARDIAVEAQGHPLFIDELVRHALDAPGAASGPLDLEEALWSRIGRLDAQARALLELVAVAGAPLPSETALTASGLDYVEFNRTTSLLRVASLVRTASARGAPALEPYHDRVRAAVLEHLDKDTVVERHRAIALSLEAAERADLESLFVHWLGAGEVERASSYAARAAEEASTALAFDRAARLYRYALEHAPADGAAAQRGRVDLHVKLGEALTFAGRSGQAAQSYLQAALLASGAESLDLQRRAAEQLLLSGRVDEGLKAMGGVLVSLGMPLPPSARAALGSLAWRRLRLGLRGLRYKKRDPSELPARELGRIDACWSVAVGLSQVDALRGADFQARHLLLALEAGEPSRITRALGVEIGYSAFHHAARSARRVRELLARLDAAAAETADPMAPGWRATAHAVANYALGRWSASLALCDEAEEILRACHGGHGWELGLVQLLGVQCLAYLGRTAELRLRLGSRLKEALERGDLYAATPMRLGHVNAAWLARDDVEGARRAVEAAMRSWDRGDLDLQHYQELVARVQIDLYLGDGAAAWRRVSERLPAFAPILRYLRLSQLDAWFLAARAALAGAAAAADTPARLAGEAARLAARLDSEPAPWSRALSRLVEANVAAVRGLRAEAAAGFGGAAELLDEAEMSLLAQVARRRRGQLLGGDEGRALVAAADAWMIAQKVTHPARLAAIWAPGVPE